MPIKTGTTIKRRHPAWTLAMACLGLLMLLAGCLKTYGRFALDRTVDEDFRSGVLSPQFNYYYAGRESMPYAIIGIDKAYTVPSRYWIRIDPDPATLKAMSANMFGEQRSRPYGARILGPDGQPVGIWYSTVDFRSVRVDSARHRVEVLFTNPENEDFPNAAE